MIKDKEQWKSFQLQAIAKIKRGIKSCMEDHIFHCESCKGCSAFLKWQSQIFMEAKNGVWENIVMW